MLFLCCLFLLVEQLGKVSNFFISVKCIWRLLGCTSLGFIARGMDMTAPSTWLFLALLADLDRSYMFVGFRLGRGCWVGAIMIASSDGLLNFCRCCALRLEDRSQVGIIPICGG